VFSPVFIVNKCVYMITRTFLDKSTTIKLDSKDNFGLNPICMLGYGVGVYRFLVHFNIDKLKSLVEDKTYCNSDKLTHHLKMKNCGAVDVKNFRNKISCGDMGGIKERATSFDIIAFKVNMNWDEGVGFDNTNDYWSVGKGVVSEDGATWFNASTGNEWEYNGIYTNNFIQDEYEKYISGVEDTIIVGSQHFDYGNENLDIDLTDYVNSLIDGSETNYGLCIAFSPYLEETTRQYTQYVGFFNEKTNTIFEPVLETRYNFVIKDARYKFVNKKTNNLYLYSYIGGELTNLDRIPTCKINNIEYNVNQATKGCYYITLDDTSSFDGGKIQYDTWSDIISEGDVLDDVELEFVIHNSKVHFNIGDNIELPKILNPIISGVNDNEKLNVGEKRTIKVFFKVPYTNSEYKLVDKCWYRIYTKDGDREVSVIDWDNINIMSNCNLFTINTDELVPSEYHIDIKADFGGDIKIFKNELSFKIVSEVTEINM